MSVKISDDFTGGNLPETEILPTPSNPMAVARELLIDYQEAGKTTLLSWRGGWMRWCGGHWVEIEDDTLRSSLYKRLEHAEYVTKDKEGKEKIKPWAPNKYKVANVMDAMRAICHLPETVSAPSWLDDGNHPPAAEIVATASGLLHVGTRELLPLTPLYFNLVSVPFPYDPYAPEPTRWLKFLHQLWPDDPESIRAVQDWFGYVISGRTDLQKILLMIGPIRSGKGTIARVLEALLGGKGNVAGSTMASLATNFGLEPLVGKPLCVISDARLSTQNAPQALERLLSISGEDMITVDRKYKAKWTGTLPTRFFLISNELPRFLDPSGAIASRFIVARTVKSFLGREDRLLTAGLLTELSGILNWALVGLDRITHGPFTMPKSSEAAVVALQDLMSPVSAFVRDECEVEPDHEIDVQVLYAAWRRWCVDNGHHITTVQGFGRDLLAVLPGLQQTRPRDGDSRIRRYVGLKLKPFRPYST
jgi:putative DNA primase/helicase